MGRLGYTADRFSSSPISGSIHENLVLGVVLIDMIHGFLIVPVLPRRSCARASPCSKAVKRREGTYQGSISERSLWGSNMARRRHSGAYFTEDSGDSGSEDYAIRYDLKLPLAPFMSMLLPSRCKVFHSRPLSNI